jgi:competence protein ComEA
MYIQIEGDTPFPGVYPVQTQADGTMVFHQRVESFIQGLFPLDADPCIIRSGTKWTLQQEGDGRRFFSGEMSAFYKHTLGIPIAINQESEEGLTAISGIGPQLAKTIVQERTRRGGFHNLDELRSVRGVGAGLLKKIAPFIIF